MICKLAHFYQLIQCGQRNVILYTQTKTFFIKVFNLQQGVSINNCENKLKRVVTLQLLIHSNVSNDNYVK